MGLFDMFKKDNKDNNLRSKYLRRFEIVLGQCSSDEELFKDVQLTFSKFEHIPELNNKIAKEIDDQIYALIDNLHREMETSKSEARSQAVHKILFKIENLIQQRKSLTKDFDESPKIDFIIENNVVTGYVGNGGDIVVPSDVEAIAPKAFYNNQAIRSVVLQEGVKIIGEEAFYLCKALNYVKLPSTLAKIEQSAFYGCRALERVDAVNGLITIEHYAFARCKELKKFTVPRSLTVVRDKAFGSCDNLPRETKKALKSINKDALID